MNDLEIPTSGYGYQVRLVDDLDNIDQDLAASIEWALGEIHKIQKAARSGSPITKPRWPVLILRTPKVSSLFYVGDSPSNYNDDRDGVLRSHSTIKSSKALSTRIRSLSLQQSRTRSNSPCSPRGSHLTSRLNFSRKMEALSTKLLKSSSPGTRRKGLAGGKKRTRTTFLLTCPNGRRVPLRNSRSKVA